MFRGGAEVVRGTWEDVVIVIALSDIVGDVWGYAESLPIKGDTADASRGI